MLVSLEQEKKKNFSELRGDPAAGGSLQSSNSIFKQIDALQLRLICSGLLGLINVTFCKFNHLVAMGRQGAWQRWVNYLNFPVGLATDPLTDTKLYQYCVAGVSPLGMTAYHSN